MALSNAELAQAITDLIQKYNVFTADQMAFFTSELLSIPMHAPDGEVITVPTLRALMENAGGGGGSGDLSVYLTVDAGMAAVDDGGFFFVLLAGGAYLGLYQRSALVAVELGRYPSGVGVKDLVDVADIGSAMEHADAIMLTPFNEFDLDTLRQVSNTGVGFNTVLDEYVRNKQFNESRANFIYTVADDLGKLPSIKTVMVWEQWFSTCDSVAGVNPGVVQPAINGDIYSKLDTTAQWSAGNVSAPNALKLQGQAGGTQNDASLIRGLKYLEQRGYEIGFVPIVLGWVNATGIPQSQALVWRGFFNWTTTALFQTWLTSYMAFCTHYITLFQTHGVTPKRWLLGSEFDRIVTQSTNEQWGLFVAAMATLANQVKAAFPGCRVTYAANYSDYGVGGNFRLDALWSHPSVDEVGIEWYFRLTDKTDVTSSDILGGLVAGEDVDYTYNLSNDQMRQLTKSTGRGKLDETRIPMDASAGIKNTLGFWGGAHYVNKQAGFLAQPTQLPGFGMDYAPYGLGGVTGTGVAVANPSINPPQTSGQHPPPPLRSTWFRTNGSTTYGVFRTPTYSGGSQTEWSFELDFRLISAPAGNYARVIRLGNAMEILIDTGTMKFGVGADGAQYFADLGPMNTVPHNLQVTFNLTTGMLSVTYDGVRSDYSVGAASRAAIPSNAEFYIGGYNTNSNMVDLAANKLALSFVRSGVRWGGTFWFDDAYAGVRTAWVPKSKPMSATELGFASMSGSVVEPSQFTYADVGPVPMALPAILNPLTRALFQSFIDRGWLPVEVYGSYGSSFNYDPQEQVMALRESLRFMAALRQRGALDSITIYNLDARPAESMTAVLQGKLYYSDAPTAILGHAINGKLAGGSTLFHDRIISTGSIF